MRLKTDAGFMGFTHRRPTKRFAASVSRNDGEKLIDLKGASLLILPSFCTNKEEEDQQMKHNGIKVVFKVVMF